MNKNINNLSLISNFSRGPSHETGGGVSLNDITSSTFTTSHCVINEVGGERGGAGL